MSGLIEAADLTFLAGGRRLVDGASLSLRAGELIAMVGPNGAGKTTLLKLLTGERRPAGGRVTIDGRDVAAMPAWDLACRRAVMPQATRLAFPFAVAEFLRLGVVGVGRNPGEAARRRMIDRAMAAADLSSCGDRQFQTLSGGEQQRAHFARALAQLQAGRSLAERQILFLDEPVASLDLSHQLMLMEAARREARSGVGVIAVLHDLNLAATFADRIVVMAKGAVAACGAPADILSQRLIADVFGVNLPVSQPPRRALPFVLPQHYAPISADGTEAPAPAPRR